MTHSATHRPATPASSRRRTPRGADARGSVTAELALALPAVLVLLCVVVATGQVVMAQVRCVDAARAAARLAARGEPSAAILATAHEAAPARARVGLYRSGSLIRVDVRAVVRLPLPGMPGIPVQARAVAEVEQP